MRTIKSQHEAVSSPIADLITYRAIPTHSVDYIDPFLFLNHHGPQKYGHNNRGLPFGPHPHRGFETVTFILKGDILHRDSGGNTGTILPGGVQWMTAGSGLIHEEISSEEFKAKGGDLEILQLWVNLPAKYKMVKPNYVDLQKEDIPSVSSDEGKVVINVVSGSWGEVKGAYQSLTDIHLATIYLKAGAKLTTTVAAERNIFFYVIEGNLIVNGEETEALHLVEFNNDDEEINIEAKSDTIILFGHALPYNEPVVAQGPFVMNSEDEIMQAYDDYRAGKLGSW
jgi:redox-sensitive bicupin YhaK (pirin superfamily)